MNLIFLGAPGSGKGTHATRIKDKFGIPHISTGDILRANIRGGTELGKLAKSYIDAGELVPDSVVIDIVKARLQESDCQKGYILDGFPRTVPQAEAMEAFTKVDLAINLVLDDDVIIKRVAGRRMCACGETYHVSMLNGSTTCAKCGKTLYQRDDDKEETVKNRLEVYNKSTAPLIGYYKSKGVVVDVDGLGGVDLVYSRIERILKSL